MSTRYPWLSDLAQQCAQVTNPCPIILSGLKHAGLYECVIDFLQTNRGIEHPLNHPDVVQVESLDKNIGIDAIRDLVAFTQLKPTRLPYKVVIIHPLDALSGAAQQSFLKTLEEAVVPTYFFLICYNINAVLPTIKSRSICINMGNIDASLVSAYAVKQGKVFDRYDTLIASYAPLYHEEENYGLFKQVFSQCLEACLSGASLPVIKVTWDKISPDIQFEAIYLALSWALKEKPYDATLQKVYSAMLSLARLKSANANINLAMHLDAVFMETDYAR